ncbi:MAG: hypothetical protein ACSLFM_01855 [Tepidiformaceae bacterium]
MAGRRWAFAAWMAAAAVLAALGGLVLGILAALEVGIGAEQWNPSVQAHGRIQLFGFLAVFIVALALEFVPRLNQRQAFPAMVRLGVPGLLAGGALLSAIGQVWHKEASVLVLPGAAASVIGVTAFAVRIWRTPAAISFAVDPQPLFLRGASAWLVIATLISVTSLLGAEAGVVRLVDSRAATETFLRGFVFSAIVGVGIRAFVGHFGLREMSGIRQIIVFMLLNLGVTVWLFGQGLGDFPRSEIAIRAGDVAFAITALLATAWFGVFPRLRERGVDGYVLMGGVAWAGLVIYAVMLLVAAVFVSDGELSLYQEGAIRHVFMLGFVIPLMVTMSHVVLARFGTGSLHWPRALAGAFVLVVVAWPLRVFPALFEDAPSDAGKSIMGFAGLLVIAGLCLVAAVSVRTAVAMVTSKGESVAGGR